MGRANRLLAHRARSIATAWERTAGLSEKLQRKVIVTGNPVRHSVLEAASAAFRTPREDEPFRLVIFGGSQGARFFSEVVPAALGGLTLDLRKRLQITQQCRPEDVEKVRAAYATAGISAELAPFFGDLPGRIAESHLVIARAGASTVTELTVIGRPSMLVPLPHSLDNDQLNNARRLADQGAAWCFEQNDLTPDRLQHEISRLIESPGELATAAAAASKMGKAGAAGNLADLAEKLAGAS
jgi:UDP-N-acetylglucosamine--N-acetylmuramyl-(pentapeptide) pyrophosphoryl-undecaprenol N-acetylglucosamine transferase